MTSLRDLKSNLMGNLVEVRAMVTRISEVKPLIHVACYICEACGCEIYQVISRRTYTPSLECPSNICQTNNTRGRITPNYAVSKFVPFQEVIIQETSDQTPIGSVPRNFTVHCRGGLTRQCVPGDIIHLTGVFLPKVTEHMMGAKDRLTHDTYIEATKIIQEKKRYCDLYLSQDMVQEVKKESRTQGIFAKVSFDDFSARKLSLSGDLRNGGCQKSSSSANDWREHSRQRRRNENQRRYQCSFDRRSGSCKVSASQASRSFDSSRSLHFGKGLFWGWSHSCSHERSHYL